MDGNLATLSSANGGREPRGVCRYFSSRGECYYGPECQYLHQNPRGSSESSGALPAESKLSKYIMSENHMNHPQATSGMSNGHHGFRPTAKPILGASHHVMSRGSPSGHSHMGSQASSHSLQSGSSINGGAGVLPLLQGTGGRMSNQHVTYTQLPIPPPSYFMSEDIRVDQMRKQSLLMSVGNPEMYSDVPVQVENYHDLVPLEETPGLQSTTFGFGCSVYKAMCVKTGDAVCLRRVHDFPTPGSATRGLMATIETWKKVTHGNIVSLRHVFITKEFGDSSLIFVYDYHPGSQTLNSQYFLHSVNSNALGTPNGSGAAAPNRPWSQQPNLKLLPEPLIWSYIIQLSSGLRLIHSQNLSCRAFDPSKILMTCGLLNDPKFVTNQQLNQQLLQQPRLRLNCCGMFDVLTHESFSGHHHHTSSSSSPAATSQFQQEDLFSLGKICLALACNSSQSVKRDQWVSSLEIVARHYSSDLRTLIVTLLSVKGPQASSRTITVSIHASIHVSPDIQT